MSQYRINEQDCPHPDFALEFRSAFAGRDARPEQRDPRTGRITQYAQSAYPPNPNQMKCGECGWAYTVKDVEAFVKVRETKYLRDEGRDAAIKRDMFGNVIKTGSMVVYPSLSGRSATLSYGQIIEINPPIKSKWAAQDSWSEWARRARCDQPDRLRVRPMPYTSRWKNWSGADAKIVNLTANAPSVVVIK